MSYTCLFCYIIFQTKYSEQTINKAHANDLYRYIWGIIKKKGVLYRINGMPDYLHLFVQLPASMSVADFVHDVKGNSSKWLMLSFIFYDIYLQCSCYSINYVFSSKILNLCYFCPGTRYNFSPDDWFFRFFSGII